MFGEALLHGSAHSGLRIPVDAVIDSGTEKIVFVAIGDGKFAPRAIGLGASDGTQVEVVEGLVAGERVVTRANFLIDSESRLRASLAEMAPEATAPQSARVLPGGAGATDPSTAGTGAPTSPTAMPSRADAGPRP
jgi:Cu(I)/Ag(I) efflux system membrane fusion protein